MINEGFESFRNLEIKMESNVCRLLETLAKFIYNRAFGSAVHGGLVQEKGKEKKERDVSAGFGRSLCRVVTLRTVRCRHAAGALVTAGGAGGGV